MKPSRVDWRSLATTVRARLPMTIALMGVAAVWALSCVWTVGECLAARGPGGPPLLAPVVAILVTTVSFVVLLSELRRQARDARGLQRREDVPAPRALRFLLAPVDTIRMWRRAREAARANALLVEAHRAAQRRGLEVAEQLPDDELGRPFVPRAAGQQIGHMAAFLAVLCAVALIFFGITVAICLSGPLQSLAAGLTMAAVYGLVSVAAGTTAASYGRLWSASVTRTVVQETVRVREVESVREVEVVRTVTNEVQRTVHVQVPMAPKLEETDVYRLYDAGDSLLYVGIGSSARERWLDHAKTKAWWSDVVRERTVRYPFRGQALAVEQSAIRHENPKHNRHSGSLNDSRWPHGWSQPRHVTATLPLARLPKSITEQVDA